MNYFVEGLQGSGKTTFLRKFSQNFPDYQVFWEGDYSPVELAWCTYMSEEEYLKILNRYPSMRKEIEEKSVREGNQIIIPYTQILTDLPNFHKDLETFEIYHGNLDKEHFESVVLDRFGKWNGEKQIFECSLMQNILENEMLYLDSPEEEIEDFYAKLKDVLKKKNYQIFYLDMENIEKGIDKIRKERTDHHGQELWFPMMIRYVESSPWGKRQKETGYELLLEHLEKRRKMEHKILQKFFQENAVIKKAKHFE